MINPFIYFLLFLKASLFSTGGFSNLPSLHQDLLNDRHRRIASATRSRGAAGARVSIQHADTGDCTADLLRASGAGNFAGNHRVMTGADHQGPPAASAVRADRQAKRIWRFFSTGA